MSNVKEYVKYVRLHFAKPEVDALRKVGSTETRNEDLETQKAVQAVMTHNRTTAEQHYQILKRTKQAVKGHDALAKKLGLQDSVATNFPESPTKSPGKNTCLFRGPADRHRFVVF